MVGVRAQGKGYHTRDRVSVLRRRLDDSRPAPHTAAGMVQIGTVALDGTKLAANASDKANRIHDKLEAEADRRPAPMSSTRHPRCCYH